MSRHRTSSTTGARPLRISSSSSAGVVSSAVMPRRYRRTGAGGARIRDPFNEV